MDELTIFETPLVYGGVGFILYLCFLEYRHIKRRRRHRRHQARKRAHATAHGTHTS